MKKIFYTGALLFAMVGLCPSAMAQQGTKKQQPDAWQQQKLQHNFYRNKLGVDSAKAAQVSQVQENYKVGLKAVVADTSLNIEGRRAKIRALIEVKNQRLGQLLTQPQQQKMIPTTERAVDSKKQ